MPQGPPILEENVANLAPTWVPRWSQNGEKIDAKIDQKIDAFQDRIMLNFFLAILVLEHMPERNYMYNR